MAYCKKCGTQLNKIKGRLIRYDNETGQPLHEWTYICPNKKGRFDGHRKKTVKDTWITGLGME
jgi:hypothetical protein